MSAVIVLVSRLVLSGLDFSNESVSQDHNSKNLFEKARVIVQGGWYENRYLFGKINTTRGLGYLWQIKKIKTCTVHCTGYLNQKITASKVSYF